MNMKKPLTIVFALLLLTSIVTVAVANPWDSVVDDPTPAEAVWVDPTTTLDLDIGDEFVVDVILNTTAGVYGFEYKLFWNGTMIDAIDIQYHAPAWTGGWTEVKNETGVWSGGARDGLNYHWLSLTQLGAFPDVTGVMSMCTYKFKVLLQPGEPEPDYVGALDLAETEFTDDTASLTIQESGAIGTTQDGEYIVNSIPVPKPKVGLDPDYVLGVYAENFTVDIVIEAAHPLFAVKDLVGWEAKLSYNTTMLDALECTEGAWFKGFEGVNGTYPICNINDTLGIVHMADMYLGAHTNPSGAGILMTIVFNATWMYTVPPGIPPVTDALDLFDVLLVDSASDPIELFGVNDGVYEAPYKTLGWALDCYTDSFRKKCVTPFIGMGPNATADAYEPQDMVILYSYLTFNEWPQQNWIVSFEIYGPRNPYDNITIFRTAITNASGVATINFTIPWPCDNPYDIIFGKWTCIQYAQVKDPWAGEDEDYSARPFDILKWDVGWIVELLDVTVDPDPVAVYETLNITICYKSIMQIPKDVVITVTIYDTLLDPIGEDVFDITALPGVYCNPMEGCTWTTIEIPKWAHVGPGAQVFVNAYTALPSAGGCVYCPEISAIFTIVVP